MSKLKTAFLLLIAVTLCGISWHFWRHAEPTFEGKGLQLWINYFEDKQPQHVQDRAADAVRQMGTRALPALMTILASQDSDLSQKLKRLAKKLPLLTIDCRPSRERHYLAARALNALGASAQPAIRQLSVVLANDDVVGEGYGEALFDLLVIGPQAILALLNELRVDHGLLGANTGPLETIYGIVGENPEASMSVLLQLTAHDDPYVRAMVIQVLAHFPEKFPEASAVIEGMFEDTNAMVRNHVIWALETLQIPRETPTMNGATSGRQILETERQKIVDIAMAKALQQVGPVKLELRSALRREDRWTIGLWVLPKKPGGLVLIHVFGDGAVEMETRGR